MHCPLCRRRQARRPCPALGHDLCGLCCGTKRIVHIACPPSCGYLASAEAHPPAVVRRQQDRDLRFILTMREGLSAAQSDIYWDVLDVITRFQSDPLLKLTDEDLAEAAAALAATFETADRGIIYEHRPRSLMAQRLLTELRTALAERVEQASGGAARTMERDLAVVLRHVERGAREAHRVVDDGPTTALDMVGRVVRAAARSRSDGRPASEEATSPLLVRP